jgi:hypothetical protein
VPVAAPAAAPAAAAATTTATITPQMTPEIPSVGTFVKKKFLWPEDTGAGASDGSL